MLIFTDTHYSMVIPLSDTRTKLEDPAKATAAELLAVYGPFIANSGTYEVENDSFTLHATVAKNPEVTKQASHKITFTIKGDTLTTIISNTTMTFKRLE